MDKRPVIAICPQTLATDPRFKHLRNPITIDHSPWKCDRCHTDCWIGPRQKIVAALGNGEAVCYLCIFADDDLAATVERHGMVELNPGIEQRPRRL